MACSARRQPVVTLAGDVVDSKWGRDRQRSARRRQFVRTAPTASRALPARRPGTVSTRCEELGLSQPRANLDIAGAAVAQPGWGRSTDASLRPSNQLSGGPAIGAAGDVLERSARRRLAPRRRHSSLACGARAGSVGRAFSRGPTGRGLAFLAGVDATQIPSLGQPRRRCSSRALRSSARLPSC